MVVIYHNPRCGKSRDTLALLQDRGLTVEIVEYLRNPPTAEQLTQILRKLNKSAADILRPKEAEAAGLMWRSMSEAQLIEALVQNPIALERPIVVHGDKAALGRPPENVLAIL